MGEKNKTERVTWMNRSLTLFRRRIIQYKNMKLRIALMKYMMVRKVKYQKDNFQEKI